MLLFILYINLLCVVTQSWPKGAPIDSCDSLEPNAEKHGKSIADPTKPIPFKIIPSTDKYDSGDRVTVLITGGSFKGFMLQARSMFTGERVGQFIEPPPGTKLLNCSAGNALTHDGSKQNLQGLKFLWIAPTMSAGTINFHGAIVKNKQLYWTDLKSNPLVP